MKEKNSDMKTEPNGGVKGGPSKAVEAFVRGRTDSELRTIKLADSEALDMLAESAEFAGLVSVFREFPGLVLAEMRRRPYVGSPDYGSVWHATEKGRDIVSMNADDWYRRMQEMERLRDAAKAWSRVDMLRQTFDGHDGEHEELFQATEAARALTTTALQSATPKVQKGG